MGMYTELFFAAEIKSNEDGEISDQLHAALQGIVGGLTSAPDPDVMPDHPFFRADRWFHLGRRSSYSFHGNSHSEFRHDSVIKKWTLVLRCSFKDYDDELEKFLDWIEPHCYIGGLGEEPEFMGFHRHEEQGIPTLIMFGSKEENP